MAFKGGVVLGTISFNATGSGTTAIGATSNTGTISIGNTSSAVINIDCGTAGINVGATANAHASIFGSTNSTSSTTVQSGTGALAVTSANGTLTVNSGTGALGISTDGAATTISIGTGAAVKGVTLGSINSTSATTVQSGTGALNVTATNGAITMNSGTGTLAIADDATAQTVNIATGAGAKLVTLGTTIGASSLALKTGTADFSLASATGTIMSALDTGEITYPLQSAFGAYLGTTDSNVTGNGTNFRLGSGNALTELFDQNNDFVTTGTFTAPVTGKYFFFFGVLTQNTLISHTTWQPNITTTGTIFNLAYQNGFVNNAASAFLGGNGSVFCQMTAGDTCTFNIIVTGGTQVVEVIGNQGLTFMGGHLVC